MKKICTLIVLFALFLGSILYSFAQFKMPNKKELEQEKKDLYKEIETAQKLLKNTQNTKNQSLQSLKVIQQQLQSRKQVIQTITQQTRLIQQKIDTINLQVTHWETRLQTLKNEYAQMIQQSYLTQTAYNRLLFLFSANSLNDAYRRLKFLQYHTQFRKSQLNQIKQTTAELLIQKNELQQIKYQKDTLLTAQNHEHEQLQVELGTEKVLLQTLKNKEQLFKNKIDEKKHAIAELNNAIQKMINQEVAANTTKTKSGDATADNTNGDLVFTETEPASISFSKSKGKLPWPVDNGVITSHFGRNNHPVLKNIVLNNNGIDISTQPDSPVKAIYEGTVTNTLYSPGFQWAVMVKQGNYFVVYSNLKNIKINKGAVIKAGQTVGYAYTDIDEEKTEIHLEIWRQKNKLNPARWLRKK